ncbi:zinc finger protein 518B [Triplophysa dalaica]|uniref:zinc finger protein 518B n=1 Tax=Triplophysa dalaica TaxID=1582913 RepID=UPI0024DFE6AF|nr:zinc finger protein 518B [Triplophysa dalaica]
MRSQQSFMSFLSKDEAVPTKDNDRLCCAKCRFSTKDMDLFQRHVSHHKEVTFSCALCSHVSYSITESQKHVVSHTGSYPYRCSFCSYGAVRRDYMVKHIQRIHKRSAEKGFFTNFDEITPSCGHPSVTDTHRTSGWPERPEHCMNPSTASQSKGNAHVEYLSGSQTRTSISKTVSKTSSGHSYLTCSTTRQSVANTTLAQTQFTGAAPSYTSNTSNSLGNTTQVVPRSGQENGNLSSSLVSGDSQVGKVGCSKPILETPSLKAAFTRVPTGCTDTPLISQRSGVPERPIHSKSIPKIKVQLPVEMTSPLRPLLNMPSGALTQRTVTTQNGQTDHRVSQSVMGTNSLASQKKNLTATLINSQVKHSERSPVVSTQREQTTEKSIRMRTTPIILRRSSAKKASPLSNVQVELLAPLNQPIEHNKPLTVSCPEEINIPAGCLVELVEVKNVNGTRELELRLVPPNGTPQELKYTVDRSTPVATGKEMSFKCQVATESTASPSMSLTGQMAKQQPPSRCSVQSVRKTQHKPQHSSDIAVKTVNKQNQKSNGPAFKPLVAACEGTEVSSEGLPVISSVFSLCPTPTSTASVSQFVSEFNNSRLQTNGPLFKLQRELKNISDDESKMSAMKGSKENVRSVVCSISIKKEEETEEKPKVEDMEFKESKTELETVENSKTTETCGQENTTPNMLEKRSNLNARDLNDNPNMTNSPIAGMQSNKKNVSDKDKRDSESQSGNDLEQRSCQASLMYPKVALVRIPSSLLEPNKKVPETPPQEESLTARPVLYCKLTEQNMSSGHEGAIKLILKRDFPKDQNLHAPPRKKRKKGKTRKHKSVSMNFQSFLSKDRELRLTPLKEDQLVKLPGPNQPVVVLNHPNPSVQMVSVGVQTLKNFKWIRSVHHSQEQREVPVSNQPSLKMKLKKVTGQKYRVIELVVRGLSEKLLNV